VVLSMLNINKYLGLTFITLLSVMVLLNTGSYNQNEISIDSLLNPNNMKKDFGLIDQEIELQNEVHKTLNKFQGGFLPNPSINSGEITKIFYSTASSHLQVGFSTSKLFFKTQTNFQSIDSPALDVEYSSEFSVFSIEFIGSNQVNPVAENPTSVYVNFFTGLSENWQSKVPYYEKVIYYNLYDNIDLVYLLSNGEVKYEFIVHPKGNVDDIQMQWNGNLSLDQNSDDITIQVESSYIDQSTIFTDTAPINFQGSERQIEIDGVAHANCIWLEAVSTLLGFKGI